MVRVRLLTGRSAKSALIFSKNVMRRGPTPGKLVNPEAELFKLINDDVAWRIEFVKSDKEERRMWGASDLIARACRAFRKGWSVFLDAAEYPYFSGFENYARESKEELTVVQDGPGGLRVEARANAKR